MYLTNMFYHYLTSFFSLLVIINPVGIIPIFLMYTAGDTEASKNKTIRMACFTIIILTFITSIIGSYIFLALGISISALQAAGGILLSLIGLNMMMGTVGKKGTKSEEEEAVSKENIAIVPLTIPMMAGPAYISALTIFTANDWISKIVMAFYGIPLALIVYLSLKAAGQLYKILGETGVTVTTRLAGIIITSVAIESLVHGVYGLWYGGGA